MATIVSDRTSREAGLQGRRVRDIAKSISYLDPESAPFTQFTTQRNGGSASAHDPKVEWQEKDLAPRLDLANGAQTSTDTTLAVDNGAYFGVGDIVLNPRSAELFRVESISSNTLTVTRAVDGDQVTGATIGDNDDLFIIGNAIAEGAGVGTPKSHQETQPYNLTQIFRHAFGATETEQNSLSYSGDDRVRQRKEQAVYHNIDLERSFLFGERALLTTVSGSTASPIRIAGGFLYYVTSAVAGAYQNASGTLTEAELETFTQNVFSHTGDSSNSRVLAASPLVVSVIDQLAAGRIQTVSKDKTYGVGITQWITAHGTMNIVKHRLLEDGASGNGFADYALAVDTKKLRKRYLKGRDTQLLIDRQAPGDDKWVDEYLTECGWEIQNPGVHGVLYGVTG